MQRIKEVTGIILSGGRSTRMGENKAFIQIEGVPIIQRILALFRELFGEIIIVTNQEELFEKIDARIVVDLLPNAGALGGLYTGLFFSSFRYSFCVACDMPFLNGSLIKHLSGRLQGYDVIVPRTRDGLQPLHAYYSRDCIEPIKKLMQEGKHKIIDFYPMVKLNVIHEDELDALDPDGESFININTPEELDSIQRRRIL